MFYGKMKLFDSTKKIAQGDKAKLSSLFAKKLDNLITFVSNK